MMHRLMTITSPAADQQLLSVEELRRAIGIEDASMDARLSEIGLRVAAEIAAECNIATGLGAVPTLRRETVTETLRSVHCDRIMLRRRHEIAIASVVEDGSTLTDGTDYVVDGESGVLWRLASDLPDLWSADRIVIVYAAGFDTVPPDLRDAAARFVRAAWMESTRDPLVKGVETDIPGVMRERTDYWVGTVPGQSGEGAVPDIIDGKLKRFRNTAVA